MLVPDKNAGPSTALPPGVKKIEEVAPYSWDIYMEDIDNGNVMGHAVNNGAGASNHYISTKVDNKSDEKTLSSDGHPLNYSTASDIRLETSVLKQSETLMRMLYNVNCSRVYDGVLAPYKYALSSQVYSVPSTSPTTAPDPDADSTVSSLSLLGRIFNKLVDGSLSAQTHKSSTDVSNIENALTFYLNFVSQYCQQSNDKNISKLKTNIENVGLTISESSVKSLLSRLAKTTCSINANCWMKVFHVLVLSLDESLIHSVYLEDTSFKVVLTRFLKSDINLIGSQVCYFFRKLLSQVTTLAKCHDIRSQNGNLLKVLLLEVFLDTLDHKKRSLDSQCYFIKTLSLLQYCALGETALLTNVIRQCIMFINSYLKQKSNCTEVTISNPSVEKVWGDSATIEGDFIYSVPVTSDLVVLYAKLVKTLIESPISDKSSADLFKKGSKVKSSSSETSKTSLSDVTLCNHMMRGQLTKLVADKVVEDRDTMLLLLESLIMPSEDHKHQSSLNASIHSILKTFNW